MRAAHFIATALLLGLAFACGPAADEYECRAGLVTTYLPKGDSCEDFRAHVEKSLAVAYERTGLTLQREVFVSVNTLAFTNDDADARTGGKGTWIAFRTYRHSDWLACHEFGHAVLQQHGRYEGHGPNGVNAEWDTACREAVRRDALEMIPLSLADGSVAHGMLDL